MANGVTLRKIESLDQLAKGAEVIVTRRSLFPGVDPDYTTHGTVGQVNQMGVFIDNYMSVNGIRKIDPENAQVLVDDLRRDYISILGILNVPKRHRRSGLFLGGSYPSDSVTFYVVEKQE